MLRVYSYRLPYALYNKTFYQKQFMFQVHTRIIHLHNTQIHPTKTTTKKQQEQNKQTQKQTNKTITLNFFYFRRSDTRAKQKFRKNVFLIKRHKTMCNLSTKPLRQANKRTNATVDDEDDHVVHIRHAPWSHHHLRAVIPTERMNNFL